MFGYFDPTYWMLMLPGIALVVLAQIWVSSTYRKWSQVRSSSGLSGVDAARRLLGYSGLQDVSLEGTAGQLTDHYDPRRRVLRLSAGVAQSPSVASLAITAHEIGHALQDRAGYFPLRLRAALVPAVNLGSWLGWILIFVGLLLRSTDIAWLGVIAFAGGAVFALATLPVELNASARARTLVAETGLAMGEEERRGVNSMLNAAAFTYVAALATAVLQLLYYVFLVGGMGRRRR
jgi:Zn-dependent membrane protease YugP